MEMVEIQNLIGNYGFPVLCCVYMMVSNNKTLKELTTAINELKTMVQILHAVDEKGDGN